MMPRGITPANIIDQTRAVMSIPFVEGWYIEVLTERDSFVSGHWVLNGLIVKRKHAVERIHKDWNLSQDSSMLAFDSRKRRRIGITINHPATRHPNAT